MLNKICQTSEKLFMRYGIKSITMDEVAKELGISKKTLYQYVKDKGDLVRKTMMLHTQSVEASCSEIFISEENAILQIVKIARMVIGQHKEMNPGLLFDLKKYHTDTYRSFTEHRECAIMNQLIGNLKLGIEQGLYREDLHIDLTAGFYMALISECISSDHQTISSIPFTSKYAYLVNYHLHAICTEKGIQFIKTSPIGESGIFTEH